MNANDTWKFSLRTRPTKLISADALIKLKIVLLANMKDR